VPVEEGTLVGGEVYAAVAALYAASAFAVNRVMAVVEQRMRRPGVVVAGATSGGH